MCTRDKIKVSKGNFTELPKVTVQLPVYNERFVVNDLIKSVMSLDYPAHLLEVQILDDSTDDTTRIIAEAISKYSRPGIVVQHIRRVDRKNYKAGALQNGLDRTIGEFIVVLDADFIVERDFLKKTIHYFTDEKVALVQTKWDFINYNKSFLTRVQAIILNAHFAIEHYVRNHLGLFFNFNGTAGIWRKKAITDAGGWSGVTLTEDLELSYRTQMKGWKFIYLNDVRCFSELPETIKGFKNQQFRWTKGMAQTARLLLPKIIKQKLGIFISLEAIFHLLSPFCYLANMLFFIVVFSLPLMDKGIVDKYPIIMAGHYFMGLSFIILSLYFYFPYKKHIEDISFFRFLKYSVGVLTIMFANSMNGIRALIEGVLLIPSEFIRTPKHRAAKGLCIDLRKDYKKADWTLLMEIGFFLFLLFLIKSYIFAGGFLAFASIWLFIFFAGYFYFIFNSLKEELYLNYIIEQTK